MADQNKARVEKGREQTDPKPLEYNNVTAQTSVENDESSASPVDLHERATDQRCDVVQVRPILHAPVTQGYAEPMKNPIPGCNRITPCKGIVEPDVMTIEGHVFGIAEKHGTPEHIIDEFWKLFRNGNTPRYKDLPPHLLAYENPALLKPIDRTNCYYQAYGRYGPICKGCEFPCGRRVEQEGGSRGKGCPNDGACEGNTNSSKNEVDMTTTRTARRP